ncbi:protein sel-1 homolog 3-like [Bolinopsis microptera]|uniref:protein sel-1 homolog 3-like n=1 Tax=Bolinopsis microptera TaxID=2820187 RepID=UPI00307ABB09
MRIWILLLILPSSLCFHIDPDEEFQCPPQDPPFPVKPWSRPEEIFLLSEVFASSHSNKGAYHVIDETKYQSVTTGHVSVLFYPTDLEKCQKECAILQRIDNSGRLMTPQIYVTNSYKLLVLLYGFGTGKVFNYDRKIKLYTWQKVTLTMEEDGIRVCVSSLFDSHCHKLLDSLYQFSLNGAWIIGGSAHRKGMPGLIRDITIVPGDSHLALRMNDANFINKALTHFVPEITLPIAEIFFLCRAHEVGGVTIVTSLTDTDFECPNDAYTGEPKCYKRLNKIIKRSAIKRVALEAGIIESQLTPFLNCSKPAAGQWIRDNLPDKSLSNLSGTLYTAGKELLRSESYCSGVVLLVLSGCYGSPETLFTLAALFKTGILLPQNSLLGREFTLVAATQSSILANQALASQTSACPLQFAYHGAVAERFMLEWKRAESEDLIAERTRLKHGELSHQEGADDQVFQFLLMQAQQGNPEAQANIGRMFYWGQGGVDRNIEEAFEMQHAAALQNHPDGLFDAGIMLLKGHGTDKNTTKARQYLEKAAKAGHKGAPGTIGYLELNENGNVTGAVHYFNQSHQLGDTDATHNLAIIQTFYETFDPDPYYAHKMFKLASDGGHKDATMISAEQSLHGIHNQTGDCPSALKYIKKLSDQSNYVTRLMREAVKSYQDGKYDDAFLEYLILAESGIEMAQYNLGWLCQQFPFEITHQIPECTREYYSKSAGNGYGPSQAFLANHLWKKGDYYESARWYAKAADNKVDEGLFGLGYFAKEGIAVGVVTVNKTSIYFGPDQNITLTKELWSDCFHLGGEEAVVGCGVPLLWFTLTSISLSTLLTTLLPAVSVLAVLALVVSRCTSS